jgi:hypothetical protein
VQKKTVNVIPTTKVLAYKKKIINIQRFFSLAFEFKVLIKLSFPGIK